MGRLGYLLNASTAGTRKKTPKVSGQDTFVMEAFDRLNGHPAFVTNQCRSNLTDGLGTSLSETFFGNWADLLIGLWSEVDLLVNPYTGDINRLIRVTTYQDVDVAVRHAASFARVADIDNS